MSAHDVPDWPGAYPAEHRKRNPPNEVEGDDFHGKDGVLKDWKDVEDLRDIFVSGRGGLNIKRAKEDVLDLFERTEGNTLTGKDLETDLGYPKWFANLILKDLLRVNIVTSRKSGNITLWTKTSPVHVDKLPRELSAILEDFSDEGESIEEAYVRMKGCPHPDLLSEIVGENSVTGWDEEVYKNIRKRRERGRERRYRIQDRFE